MIHLQFWLSLSRCELSNKSLSVFYRFLELAITLLASAFFPTFSWTNFGNLLWKESLLLVVVQPEVQIDSTAAIAAIVVGYIGWA